MTFLLDQDTPDDLVYSLQTLHHKVVRLREVLPTNASDTDVLFHALLDGAGENGIRNNINFA